MQEDKQDSDVMDAREGKVSRRGTGNVPTGNAAQRLLRLTPRNPGDREMTEAWSGQEKQ